MEKTNESLAADIFIHRLLLAEIISMLTDESGATALHATLIQRMGAALDAEDMALSVEMQKALDAIFLISRAFRKQKAS